MMAQGSVIVRPAGARRDLELPFAGRSSYSSLLPVILRRAVEAGQPAWLAIEDGKVVGAAVRDVALRTTSVFTLERRVLESFQRTAFDLPLLTEIPPSEASRPGRDAPDYRLLERSAHPLSGAGGDPHVHPMRQEDLKDVELLASRMHGARGAPWVRQCFEDGDLAFTVRGEGAIRGYAFATAVGNEAWLHSSAVDPTFRGRGFGRALMAARLCTVDAMGIGRSIMEVAPENGASLHLAAEAGFHAFAGLYRLNGDLAGADRTHEEGVP